MTTITFQQLDRLIRSLHGLDAPSPALVARFKYFQRMSFPARSPGRGSQVGYGFEHVLQLVVAFELTAGGFGPQRAVEAVTAGWPWMRDLLSRAWTVVAEDGGGAGPGNDDVDLICVAADLFGTAAPSPLRRIAAHEWVWGPERGNATGLGRGLSLVDPLRLVARVRQALPGAAGVGLEEVDVAFASLAG